MNDSFLSYWQSWLPGFNQRLEEALKQSQDPSNQSAYLDRLFKSMRYSSSAGGKRIRALLVYLSYDCLIEDGTRHTQHETKHYPQLVHHAAYAIEFIHTYSLIHDDLPSMDNDNLRRGKPTCHIAYDEATAILAGDALQTLAFEKLAQPTLDAPKKQLELIHCLSCAAGANGMIGGQTIDLNAEGSSLSLDALTMLHHLKTGQLISAAVTMAAICANAEPQARDKLLSYAKALGLAFQVRDDIIDITSTSEQLGKPQGSDNDLAKNTFPALLGLDATQQKAEQLYQEAQQALDSFGPKANLLRGLAEFCIQRQH